MSGSEINVVSRTQMIIVEPTSKSVSIIYAGPPISGGGGGEPLLNAHLADTVDAHDASAISFVPQGSIASTNVQAAIQEVRDEAAGGGAPNTADFLVGTANAGLTSEIVVGASPGGELGGTWASPTVDASHSGSTHAAVQAAAEATAAAALTGHLNDTTDAHDASAISFAPTGTIAATDVQTAIAEVASEAGGSGGVPTGVMLDFGGPVGATPAGYLPCDGTTRSRATYAALFAVIGTTWNTGGEAGTDFRLPNTLGRVTIGEGSGAGLTARTLGQTLGVETHALSIAELAVHTHIQNSHSHTPNAIASFLTDGGGVAFDLASGAGLDLNIVGTTSSATPTNQNTGSGTAHQNMQPSTVVLKIIKI